MGIFYGMVARGQVVLSEFSATQTNAGTVARQILERINGGNSDSNSSFSHNGYTFHVRKTDSLTVFCMADDVSGRRTPFAFLEDIYNRFVKTYGLAIHSASAYAMNDEFSRVLSQQMDYFSNNPNADSLNRLEGEMNQVRNVVMDNIEKVLDRGDRLTLLVEKTDSLQGNTFGFKRQARRYRRAMWWRDLKFTATFILVILLVILYVLLTFFCNGIFLSSCLP